MEFKAKYTLEERTKESQRLHLKYPDRIPTIVEIVGDKLPAIDKNKYLIPSDLTVGQFMYVIRKRLELSPELAIFMFFNNSLEPTSKLMTNVYKEHKEECGFLFCTVSGESTFG
jgi:GABA(A) receptor-associated protein